MRYFGIRAAASSALFVGWMCSVPAGAATGDDFSEAAESEDERGDPGEESSIEGESSGGDEESSASGNSDETEPDDVQNEGESEPGRAAESDSEMDRRLDTLEQEVDRQTGDREAPSEEERSSNDDEESDESVDEAVSELESELDDEEDGGGSTPASAMNPRLSVILDTGFAWQENDPTLVGGPDPKSFGPFLQVVELAFRADVDPFFTFESHLNATLGGLRVGEAYGTTLDLPARLQMRFGKFKTLFGRVNPLHVHSWRFTALPMVNGKFYGPAGLNGLGLEVSQIVPAPWTVKWVVAVQDLASPRTGTSFLRDPGTLEGPLDLVVSGRLEQFFDLSRDWDVLWGLNAAVGRNDAPNTGEGSRSEIYGTDLFLKFKPVEKGGRSELGWQTEALLRSRQTTGDSLVDAGGYSYVYWAPDRTWEFGGRYEYVTAPFDGDRDYQNPEWRRDRQRAGLAATFFASNFSRFRLEYMVGGFRRDPAGFEDLAHTVLLQAQLVTGSHGAHKF